MLTELLDIEVPDVEMNNYKTTLDLSFTDDIIDVDPKKKYEMKDVINHIKSNVDRLRGKGFYIKTDEIDTDSDYEIVIKIEKGEKK